MSCCDAVLYLFLCRFCFEIVVGCFQTVLDQLCLYAAMPCVVCRAAVRCLLCGCVCQFCIACVLAELLFDGQCIAGVCVCFGVVLALFCSCGAVLMRCLSCNVSVLDLFAFCLELACGCF